MELEKTFINILYKNILENIKSIEKKDDSYIVEYNDSTKTFQVYENLNIDLFQFIESFKFLSIPLIKTLNKITFVKKEDARKILVDNISPWNYYKNNTRTDISFTDYIDSWNKYCLYSDSEEYLVYPVHVNENIYSMYRANDFSYEKTINNEIEEFKNFFKKNENNHLKYNIDFKYKNDKIYSFTYNISKDILAPENKEILVNFEKEIILKNHELNSGFFGIINYIME